MGALIIALLLLCMPFALKACDPDELEAIDKWLVEQKLNRYGDPNDTVYMGGSPLFDESTGITTPRCDHIKNNFAPDKPWLLSLSISTSGSPKVAKAPKGLKNKTNKQKRNANMIKSRKKKAAKAVKAVKIHYHIEKPNISDGGQYIQLVDAWLTANNLNEFGDPVDTAYTGGTPLFDESTGAYIDRIRYLIDKFPTEPWISTKTIVDYEETRLIDMWLTANNLNEFGDPVNTWYIGGTPLFDESTEAYIDRTSYLKEKFPTEPWTLQMNNTDN